MQISYKIKKNFVDFFLKSEIFECYSPIIGTKATALYLFLCNNSENICKTLESAFSINNLLKFLCFNEKDLLEARNLLEEMCLITTYLETKKDNTIYHFVLNDSLSFYTFSQNPIYKKMLISKIGIDNFEYLAFKHDKHDYSFCGTNISKPLDKKLVDTEEGFVFDFNKLFLDLSKIATHAVKIEDNAKKIINDNFVKLSISYEEMFEIILNSLVKKNNEYIIQTDAFLAKITNINASLNNAFLSFDKSNYVIRNNELFLNENFSEEQKNQIFCEYKRYNSFQYMSLIIKEDLSTENIKTLNKIKNDLLINDDILNMLIDFTFFRTKGNFNSIYIIKACRTINNLGIITLDKLREHLLNFGKKENRIKYSKNVSSVDNIKTEILDEESELTFI